METTMKLAIETYSNLTGRTFDEIVTECVNGDEVILETIKKLMFSVA
tara:strand:- start:604 stop:744 length:141 start_codon:yes stop_codon:yes gene_type:complete